MRLIDADELAVTYCEIDNQYHSEPWILDDILAFLNDAPTIEAAPVVHGRWDVECRCTVCGWYGEDWYKRDAYHFDYRPNCGARMDGDGNA